jgi:hypothetical protein
VAGNVPTVNVGAAALVLALIALATPRKAAVVVSLVKIITRSLN